LPKSCVRRMSSSKKAQFLASFDSLCAAAGAELVEGAAAMSLDGVFTHEKGFADLAIAEAASHELENFHFARGDAEALAGRVIQSWIRSGVDGNRDFDDALARGEKPGSEPDAGTGKQDGDENSIDRDRVLENNEVELGQLQQGDQDATHQPEDQYLFAHPFFSNPGLENLSERVFSSFEKDIFLI
jgi:hypothetical protein